MATRVDRCGIAWQESEGPVMSWFKKQKSSITVAEGIDAYRLRVVGEIYADLEGNTLNVVDVQKGEDGFVVFTAQVINRYGRYYMTSDREIY